MKYKMLALILALTVLSWAQTATPTTPSTPQQSTVPANKVKCPCCEKMAAADAKDAPACCAHHDMKSGMGDMKDKDGKEAVSCMKNDKDQATAPCCNDACSKDSCEKDKTAAACCAGKCGNDEKGCCKKTEKTAKNCCSKELHS
jgi:hypothetical protein